MCNAQEKLEEGDFCGLKKPHAKMLLSVIKWLEKNANVNVIEEFNEDIFEEFERNEGSIVAGKNIQVLEDSFPASSSFPEEYILTPKDAREAIINRYISQDLGSPYEKEEVEENMRKKKYFTIVEEKHLDEVIKNCKRQVMKSPYLKKEIGKFDYLEPKVRGI